ncbi:protein phosphatase 1 regulatory subunit 12a [Plakobranchus ocellatus]|uniref:Protein phosphatase 1 regulatory subunit 12a n=1 Tax=Plakobranchus ocellatus TaxID=259542 RepID=A0AAV3YKP2_9GAST|nr:protein phosphatase 1 regulatory subunit 12a [Plakobranchus ocellatus]
MQAVNRPYNKLKTELQSRGQIQNSYWTLNCSGSGRLAACIDDNLEMVEFLVENGADVDVCDNEGWTPLHATASCAFTEIARYLLKHGASVAAVNNDGDLPMDIAENDEMEKLLKEEMEKQGIDADAARCEEEQRMLEDANQWLREQNVEEVRHPKTGATALHVAAAKGYMKVMSLLLDAGVDVNAEDYDGWTPLHAAAHWGQEEACKLLVEHNCDMLYKNKAGHTALDLAEKDMLKLLEELKENQAALLSKREIDTDHILPSGTSGKRRSSVTRMSVDQKQNVIQRTSEEERAALASLHPEDKLPTIHSIARAQEEKEAEDAETERKNERNKQVSNQPQSPSSTMAITTTMGWSRPTNVASTSGVELRRPDMPKIDEVSETERPSSGQLILPASTAMSTVVVTPSPSSSLVTVASTAPTAVNTQTRTSTSSTLATGEVPPAVLVAKPSVTLTRISDSLSNLPSDSNVQKFSGRFVIPPTSSSSSSSGRDLVSRSISVPARLPTQKELSASIPTTTGRAPLAAGEPELAIPSWRQGLRKTGSSSMVHEWMSQNDSNSLPRSASSPRLALDSRLDTLQERLALRRPLSSIGSTQSTAASTVATTTTTMSVTSTPSDSAESGRVGDRSFEPPKRDEETETQRKARAKHARQTRRSTQGVSLEDLEKAEEVLRSNDSSKVAKDSVDGSVSSRTSVLDKDSSGLSRANSNVGAPSATSTPSLTTGTTTVTTTSTTATSVSSSSDADVTGQREDRSITSGYRRRALEDRNDSSNLDPPSTRSSYRRAREDRDLNSISGLASTDVTSSYVPRSQRNSAALLGDSGISSSQNLLRSSSLRAGRLRNGDMSDLSSTTSSTSSTITPTPRPEEESKRDDSSQEKKDEKKEPSAIRARRQRRERRSTGITYDNDVSALAFICSMCLIEE